MKKWRVYGYQRDYDFNYTKKFAGMTKAETEHDALLAVRKRFKHLRSQTIEVEEVKP